MTASMRDQIRHWRKRAEVAEAANQKAAQMVEEERQRAGGAVQAVTKTIEKAAGMRAVLLELEGVKWIGRHRRARIREALTGAPGEQIAAQLKASKVRELALAEFADAVEAWRHKPGAPLVELDALLEGLKRGLGIGDPETVGHSPRNNDAGGASAENSERSVDSQAGSESERVDYMEGSIARGGSYRGIDD